MQLNKFQSHFKDLMLDHPKALDTPPDELARFCEVGDIALPDRLKVYRNNIVGSLTDVMVATFPIIENLVGKAFLEGMARSFILEKPPSHGCLSLYGEGFAAFIEDFEPARALAYLPDVARFELAINKAYFAPDDSPLTQEQLSNIHPEALANTALALRSSVFLLESSFPLTKIHAFCLGHAEDETLDLDAGGEYLMIYRPHLETHTVTLEQGAFHMLSHLQEGLALGQAVERVLKDHQDFNFQSFLQKHLALETFQTL